MKFYYKFKEVEAFRYLIDEIPDWFWEALEKHDIQKFFQACSVKTKTEIKTAQKGDYIVRDEKGDMDVFNEQEFQQKYKDKP